MGLLSVEKKNEDCILRFSGELTLEVIDKLKEETEDYLTSAQCGALIMDLSQTIFLDSSGIGFLVQLNNRKKTENKEFYLFQPSPQVKKTLSLVKLLDFFNVLENEEELDEVIGE
jgi:anti-sigma B factor antagonist